MFQFVFLLFIPHHTAPPPPKQPDLGLFHFVLLLLLSFSYQGLDFIALFFYFSWGLKKDHTLGLEGADVCVE